MIKLVTNQVETDSTSVINPVIGFYEAIELTLFSRCLARPSSFTILLLCQCSDFLGNSNGLSVFMRPRGQCCLMNLPPAIVLLLGNCFLVQHLNFCKVNVHLKHTSAAKS